MLRRPLLAVSLALAASPWVRAQGGPGGTPPLRLGADLALFESGLARSLQQAFGADTGIALKLVPGPALAILDALRDAEIDAALSNAPEAELALERQGLLHDRQAVAAGEFILVGPAPRSRGKAPAPSAVDAIGRVRDLLAAAPGGAVFLSAGDGSGVHVAEQALWRAAGIAPAAPWYVNADARSGFAAQVHARSAFALVERGAWTASSGPPLAVIAEGDPFLAEPVHVMRSFRISHPAGKLCAAWLAGHRGRAVAAAHRGYRAPA
jgi:tungstate transport system substrate-binding protein